MQTIQLRVNEKVYEHLMWFLNKFSPDEWQIIPENPESTAVQKELTDELAALEKGERQLVDLTQLEQELEATIRKYEA